MISKKTIIQYINQLDTGDLDEHEFTSRIDRLNKVNDVASNVIFDLIQTADLDKRHFLFNLLSEIGDEKTVARLRDIITNPNVDDEVKLMAAVTASQIDGHFDDYLLQTHLANPEELGKKITENMLDKSENPIFIQTFLENFPRMVREGQLASLEDLLLLKGDERVVNIVGPLIEIVDDELLEYIIPILMNSYDRRAFDYLQSIIKNTKSKEIQAMARQAIFKLGTFVKDDSPAPGYQFKFHEAYATTSDGSGSSIYIFSVMDNNENKVRFIDFVNNDLLGIKDAFGGVISEKEFEEFINKIKKETGFLTVEVSPAFILEKVNLAEELTKQAHRSLPVEYLAYREIFKYFTHDDIAFEKKQAAFKQFKDTVLLEKDDLIDATEDLYDHEEVNTSWFIDYELMADPVDEYLSIEVESSNARNSNQFNKKFDNLMKRTSGQLYTKEFLSLLVDRLNDYAFLCFLGRKRAKAKLAIIAAETLFEIIPAKHPFLQQMLDRSFEVHLYEDEYYDEDEFEEFDEFEDFDEGEYDGTEYSLPYFMPPELVGLEYAPKYPELKELIEFDQLKMLATKEPKSAFAEFFNPNLEALDLKSRIKHVNYLESVFDTFVRMNAGDFDWELFRKNLNISVPEKFENALFQEIEDVFLANMGGHNSPDGSLKTAQRLWAEAVFLSDGNLKPMKKPYSWAAGIEILAGALIFNRTQMDIMEIDYQVSSSTIRNRMEQLCQILNIKVFPDPFHKLMFLNSDVPF